MNPSDLGTVVTRDDGVSVISFERRLAHPIESVWAALTEPQELIGWWGQGEVNLVEGGTFNVLWLNTDEDGNAAHMHGTITELDPPRVLETTGDLHGTLRWELTPDGDDATLLRFTATGEVPERYRTMSAAGWHWHLDALDTGLGGGSVDLTTPGEDWEAIHSRYVEKLATT
jgi:uncharacterized protein YndB with AHSA1/START domain